MNRETAYQLLKEHLGDSAIDGTPIAAKYPS